jgi:hypothetical protein
VNNLTKEKEEREAELTRTQADLDQAHIAIQVRGCVRECVRQLKRLQL